VGEFAAAFDARLSTRRRSVWGWFALAALACAITLATFYVAAGVPYERTPVAYGAGLGALLVLPLAVAIATRRFGLFDPIWPVLLLLLLQMPAQAIYLAGVSDYGNDLMGDRQRWVELINRSLLLTALAAAVFVAVYALGGRPARSVARALPAARHVSTGHALTRVIWVFSILGVLGYVTFFATVGGLGDFISNLSKHNASSAGKFYLLWVAKLFPIANLLWFMQRAARGQRSGRLAYFAHLAVALVMLLSFGGRAQVLYLIELLIVVRFFCTRDIRVRHLVAFAVIGVLFLALYGAFRESTEKRYSPREFQQLSPESQQIVREREANRYTRTLTPRGLADQVFQYDYAPLDTFVLVLRGVPDRFPYQYGATLLDVFIRPVPGALWDDKPKPLNTQYNQRLLGAERSGKKASILGEGYVNGNVVGIVLLVGALALFARAIVFYRERFAALAPAIVVYAILYKFVWSMTGGGFGEVAMGTLIYLLPVMGAFVYATPRGQRSLIALPLRDGRLDAAQPIRESHVAHTAGGVQVEERAAARPESAAADARVKETIAPPAPQPRPVATPERRPRMVFVVKQLALGGAEQTIVTLAEQLRAQWDVRVAFCFGDDAHRARLERAGIPVTQLSPVRAVAPVAAALGRLLRAARPAVVSAHDPYSAILARLTAPPGVAVVATHQNVAGVQRRSVVAAEQLTSLLRGGGTVSISREVERTWLRGPLGGALRRRPRRAIIANPVDPVLLAAARASDRRQVRARLDVPEDAELIVNVGRYVEQKGQRHLVDAFARVLRTRPRAWLVLVGYGPLESALREQAERLGVASRTTFALRRPDALEIVRSADVFAFPSLWEGLGVAVVEAMALGLPVVTSDRAPLTDFVSDGDTGMLAPPRDPAALADALERLLADRARATALGTAARELVTTRFSAERIAGHYDAFLRATSGLPHGAQARGWQRSS
jgi:glycosyltransferase involved in cell wall biosynthesis